MRLTDEQVASAQVEVEQGMQALALIDNKVWAQIRTSIDDEIMLELLKTPIDDHRKLVNLKLFKQSMVAVETRLRDLVGTGKLAGESLRLHYETERGTDGRD